MTDPAEQGNRFKAEAHQRKKSNKMVYPMPERFLTALEDMPDATGNALGIDRLVMLYTDSPSIRDVLLFPYLRPEA